MAHTHTVLYSINHDGDTICVDVFRRPDGTFGFEEFRRDPEDGRGWFAIGHYGHETFSSVEAALAAATAHVGWFDASRLTPGA